MKATKLQNVHLLHQYHLDSFLYLVAFNEPHPVTKYSHSQEESSHTQQDLNTTFYKTFHGFKDSSRVLWGRETPVDYVMCLKGLIAVAFRVLRYFVFFRMLGLINRGVPWRCQYHPLIESTDSLILHTCLAAHD